jgi:hypothetical protein
LRISFEGDSLAGIVGEMRAFLAAADRPASWTPAPDYAVASTGGWTGRPLPACPVHMVEMEYRPAGTNRRTHRRYSASYRCPRDDCQQAQWMAAGGYPDTSRG